MTMAELVCAEALQFLETEVGSFVPKLEKCFDTRRGPVETGTVRENRRGFRGGRG